MRLRWVTGALIGAALCFQVNAQTPAAPLDLAGVKVEQASQVAGASLPLNGAGIRYKLFIKVYTAALYTTTKAETLEAVIAAPGPKRIQITMLRDIDGNELGKLFTQGMERNAARADIAQSITGMVRLGELFSVRKRLVAGDSFNIDWIPGHGSQVQVNGKVEIESIREPEFFKSLLSIWLGKAPADDDLKAALLGAKTEKRRANEPRERGR